MTTTTPAAGPELLDTLDASARHHRTAGITWRSWGEGPPLVLLHGGAGSWMHWVRNIEGLARQRTLWVPDLPGMGDSELPREGLDADSIAPLVLAGLDELVPAGTFDLVGFSFGALVSAYLARLAPGRVRRLVLTGMTGMGLATGPARELLPLRGVTDPAARAAVLRNNLAAMMIHDASHIDPLAIAVQDRSAQRDRVRHRRIARSDAMFEVSRGWRCPVAGIWGEDDNTRRRDLAAFDAAVARLGLRELHVIPDAGHWVQFEQAPVFDALVLRLLAD